MTILKMVLISFVTLLITSAGIIGAIEKEEKKTFTVNFGGNLDLETDKGSISIKTHSLETVIVEVFLKAKTNNEELAEKLFNNFIITYNHNDKDIKIRAKYKGGKSWFGNLFGSSKWNKLNVRFVIVVPEKYNVDLNTSGGGIRVDDLEGYVNANTSGGSLKFGNIIGDIDGSTSGGGITIGECSGSIEVNTSGGGIEIDKCEGDVEASTSGGGITVNEVYGTINASTSGGSVFASILEQPKEDCSLTTSGGGITVKLASEINVYLDAKTSGGSVTCDFPIRIKGKIVRSKLKGEINSGGTLLYLRSSGGSINVQED